VSARPSAHELFARKLHYDSAFSPTAELVLFPGDCRDLLKTVPSDSIQLIVTSPPYNLGKEYEKLRAAASVGKSGTTWNAARSFRSTAFSSPRFIGLASSCVTGLSGISNMGCIARGDYLAVTK
jgi:hypothetical protein